MLWDADPTHMGTLAATACETSPVVGLCSPQNIGRRGQASCGFVVGRVSRQDRVCG